jgi:hypothetical protein
MVTLGLPGFLTVRLRGVRTGAYSPVPSHLTNQLRRNFMIRSLFTRRGAAAAAAVTIGLSGMSLALAGTAGAAPNASPLFGSGSQTSYAVMTSLSAVFNNASGCDLTAISSAPSTLNCGTSSFAPGTVGGEQGFAVSSENPYNDFTVQAMVVLPCWLPEQARPRRPSTTHGPPASRLSAPRSTSSSTPRTASRGRPSARWPV